LIATRAILLTLTANGFISSTDPASDSILSTPLTTVLVVVVGVCCWKIY